MGTKEALAEINRLAADMGVGVSRQRHKILLYQIPANWIGIKYQFGYTPWKTTIKGKSGFFFLKYHLKPNGSLALVKSVRWRQRKIASKKAWEAHQKHYTDPERLKLQQKRLNLKKEKQTTIDLIPLPLRRATSRLTEVRKIIQTHEAGLKKSEKAVKRKKKLIRKWTKKEQYYKLKVQKLGNDPMGRLQ